MNRRSAGLPLREQASLLITFLNQHQHTLSVGQAVALCGALQFDDDKAAAKQLKTNLSALHDIKIQHTHALNAIGRIRGRAGLHSPNQPKVFWVSARDPQGHAPRREARFPALKSAIQWLNQKMSDELELCTLACFVRVIRGESNVQFDFCSAGMVHTRWELWVEPPEAPQDGILSVSDATRVVTVIRSLVEEVRRAGLVLNAALVEEGTLHRSIGQLRLEVPGTRHEFDLISFDGFVGNELELLVDAEKHFGGAALMEGIPEHGALVIKGGRYTASLYTNGRRPAEPVFSLEPAPKQVLARLLRSYKRLVAKYGCSMERLQRRFFMEEPGQVAIQGNILASLLNDAGNPLHPSGTKYVPEKEWNLFLHTGKLSAARVLELSERFRVDPEDLISPFGVERTPVESVHGLGSLLMAADQFDVIVEGRMPDTEREQIAAIIHRLRLGKGKVISQCAQAVAAFAVQMGLTLSAEEYWDFALKCAVDSAPDEEEGAPVQRPWRKVCLHVAAVAV